MFRLAPDSFDVPLTRRNWTFLTTGLLIYTFSAFSVAGEPPPQIEFNRQIRPILAENCFPCHGPDASHRKADLRLDTAAGAVMDLGDRSALVPGSLEKSELWIRITSKDPSELMPPPKSHKTLSQEQLRLVQAWITQGGKYQSHWAYLPPQRPLVPEAMPSAQSSNPIDRFIEAQLVEKNLNFSEPARTEVLWRRVSFDLTGLPPESSEVNVQADLSLDAYGHYVERLLQSPQFGERMATFWLDLVRYANTVGYHGDQEHPISPYRDYVIAAFNLNMPFDQFTREQIAGDLLPNATESQKIASGYNRLLQTSHEGGVQVKEYLHKYDADRVRNVSGVWMAATMGCAECHDHKYDPYSQKNFYQMAAFFADVDDTRTFKGGDSNPTRREPEIVVFEPLDRLQIADVMARIRRLERAVPIPVKDSSASSSLKIDRAADAPRESNRDISSDTNAELARLKSELETLQKRGRRTMVTESIAPKTVRVLNRGDWMDETGEIVMPETPQFLGEFKDQTRRLNRLDLANWLCQPTHPLTARVFVNRIWYLLMGNGLTRSLDDMGVQGESPSHPELLDWLAVEFIESGWDVKNLVRLIVTSRTYRQSSTLTPHLNEIDPLNNMFARQTFYRLPAEMIRDQALSLSHLLVSRTGGASSHPYQPAGYYQHLNFPKRDYHPDQDDNQYRRAIYQHWQRQFLHPMLKAFDAPMREECTAQRPVSNTPLAALTLLNDPSFIEAARGLGIRILREQGGQLSDRDRINWAWHQVLFRDPLKSEADSIKKHLENTRRYFRETPDAAQKLLHVGLMPTPSDLEPVELASWAEVSRVLFNLHETITRR